MRLFAPSCAFTFSSDLDWTRPIAEIDKHFYAKYGLTKPEYAFIESRIKPMG
jgi:hypothetical protein